MITTAQQKYYAWDITHRRSVSDDARFTGVLSEARVDLNPHQVDAALFAFKSPLSKGAILADEVGLGKTIEAGIILSQCWAEHRRRILIIVPASLRSQWNIELMEKFYLPSTILTKKDYDDLKNCEKDPFILDTIIVCSYQFAAKHAEEVSSKKWDLVVLDEAHKMRNVYKKKNKIANTVRKAIQPFKKVLLTATPLQNNLNELYGLVSIIDPNYFSNLDNFSGEYNAVTTRDSARYGALKERLQNIIQRTLRRQVQEYVKYTRRSAMVQDFVLSDAEQELYDKMTEYLQRPSTYGISDDVHALMAIILRKIMASSAHALSHTLRGMISRLETYKATGQVAGGMPINKEDLEDIFEDDEVETTGKESFAQHNVAGLQYEIDELKKIAGIAESINDESKAISLLTALRTGFNRMSSMGAQRKALVFTESRRTQDYLMEYLESNGYKDKVVCFNGTNDSPQAKAIHSAWLRKHKGTERASGDINIDRKQALVDFFREDADIMIATEAGAEGINLQFCSIVVNYDMPWNPQRIEQRIGRCHRYGQKHDVVVVNFVNQGNAADRRVYELLNTKFNLFDGVFGSSDEILGALDGSIDFEKRLNVIWQTCRTEEEINKAFDDLQNEMEEVITERMDNTKHTLLEHFDEDVVKKLKIRQEKDAQRIDDYNRHLWKLAVSVIGPHAISVDEENYTMEIDDMIDGLDAGRYSLLKADEYKHIRLGNSFGEYVTAQASRHECIPSEITFDLTGYRYRSSSLERFFGQSGYCIGYVIKAESKCDVEEELVICGVSDDGEVVPDDFGRKLLDLEALSASTHDVDEDAKKRLDGCFATELQEYKDELAARCQEYLNIEIDKLYAWADDNLYPLEEEIGRLQKLLESNRRLAKKTLSATDKLNLKKEEVSLRRRLSEKRAECDKLRDYYDSLSEKQIEAAEDRLKSDVTSQTLFLFRWKIV